MSALGVDIEVVNADGCNALWLACYHGSHAIIERLTAAGRHRHRPAKRQRRHLPDVRFLEQHAGSGQAAAGEGRQRKPEEFRLLLGARSGSLGRLPETAEESGLRWWELVVCCRRAALRWSVAI